MAFPGLQLFEQQRTTIDYLHATSIWKTRFQRISEDEMRYEADRHEIRTIYLPPYLGNWEPMTDQTGATDMLINLSLRSDQYLVYNRMIREEEDHYAITCYRRGQPYYVCYADPTMIYSLGASRFFPQSTKKDDIWYYAGEMVSFYNFPAIIFPTGSAGEDIERDADIECLLASNGHTYNFLGNDDTNTFNHYHLVIRKNSPVFKDLCPEESLPFSGEYRVDADSQLDTAPLADKLTNLAAMLKDIKLTDMVYTLVYNGSEMEPQKRIKYDLMFQILDVAVILASRGIDFTVYYNDIFKTFFDLHMTFIRNMPDPQGRLPFSYPRLPLSYYANTIEQIEHDYITLTAPMIPSRYLAEYNSRSTSPGDLVTGERNTSFPVRLGDLSGDGNKLDGIRQKESVRELGGRVEIIEYVTNSGMGESLLYVHFFRDPRMASMPLSYWNLSIVTTDDVIKMPLPELYSRGHDEYDVVGRRSEKTDYGLKVDVFVLNKNSDYTTEEESNVLPDDAYSVYYRLEEEQVQPIKLKHRFITINGISFDSRDIMLLYNTTIMDFLMAQNESEVELPNVSAHDIRLLQSLFAGRVSLLYFYENISKYMFSLLSSKRTMLDIFDLLFARDIILRNYSIGTSLREQLAEIDYSDRYSGRVTRLDELIETARIASL